MPDINWNNNTWGNIYDWSSAGEEWSKCWGSSEAQWFTSLYPRLHAFLPCNNVLEIACGYGRWTKYLIPNAMTTYKGIDISQNCIDDCKSKFDYASNAFFYATDGENLPCANEGECDLVFSFDSLVHADMNVFSKYIPEILRILNKNTGVSFIHHSNLRQLIDDKVIPVNAQIEKLHWRDKSVSSKKLKELIETHGGKVLIQEIMQWGSSLHLDCITVFSHPGVLPELKDEIFTSSSFFWESDYARQVVDRYSIWKNMNQRPYSYLGAK